MKLLSLLMLVFALTLINIFLNDVFAQDYATISDCQSRCGIRTDTGQVLGNYQAIAACRDRCARQYWNRTEKQERKGKSKSSIFDD